jgi:hypothetical protein
VTPPEAGSAAGAGELAETSGAVAAWAWASWSEVLPAKSSENTANDSGDRAKN